MPPLTILTKDPRLGPTSGFGAAFGAAGGGAGAAGAGSAARTRTQRVCCGLTAHRDKQLIVRRVHCPCLADLLHTGYHSSPEANWVREACMMIEVGSICVKAESGMLSDKKLTSEIRNEPPPVQLPGEILRPVCSGLLTSLPGDKRDDADNTDHVLPVCHLRIQTAAAAAQPMLVGMSC